MRIMSLGHVFIHIHSLCTLFVYLCHLPLWLCVCRAILWHTGTNLHRKQQQSHKTKIEYLWPCIFAFNRDLLHIFNLHLLQYLFGRHFANSAAFIMFWRGKSLANERQWRRGKEIRGGTQQRERKRKRQRERKGERRQTETVRARLR